MALIEQGICRIESINNQGLGTSKKDLGSNYLPYVLPGDLVVFEKHSYRGKSNCLLKKIVEEAPTRIKPECKYFGSCGGCALQHINKESYAEFKFSLIDKALKAVSIQTTINPVIIISQGQRRRANFKAIKKDNQVYLGFHRFHSHQIINIDACPALMIELSDLLTPIKKLLCDILSHKQKAQLFCTRASNGIDLMIEISNQGLLTKEQKLYLLRFAEDHNIIIRLQFRSLELLDTVFQRAQPYIVFDSVSVATDADGFLQSCFASDQILTDLLQKYLPPKQAKVADLFCGRGTFSLPLSKYFNVDGFESDEAALNALGEASKNIRENISLEKRDLFISPLSVIELNKYDYVVINPPRIGARDQCLRLAASLCERVVYISCNPESFARDAKILSDGGYKLLEVTPVDQFYWTPHLEVVGIFVK